MGTACSSWAYKAQSRSQTSTAIPGDIDDVGTIVLSHGVILLCGKRSDPARCEAGRALEPSSTSIRKLKGLWYAAQVIMRVPLGWQGGERACSGNLSHMEHA